MSLLTLTDKQHALVEAFTAEHYKKCGVMKVRAKFVETGVGVSCKIKCMQCKESKDISDYESW